MRSSRKICVVLTKDMGKSQAHYVVTQGCAKVDSSKNGRFRYEMIG